MAQGADGGATVAVALEGAEASLLELADLEDYDFGPDKEARKSAAVETVVAFADTALTCAEKPTSLVTAKANCIKGRALSYVAGQERQSEELLSKALKLEPTMVEAWNALGEVYWNQQNYAQARNSFEQALELCGPNAVSLRNLSMVLRAVECDDIEKSTNFAAGLAKAKEATVLDANDPHNWETLGNAYMGEFFVNGKRYEELNKALIAYGRAEAAYEKLGKRNPFLHLNRGQAAKFLEDYELALKSFQAAKEIGASKGAEEYDKACELIKRMAGTVERKGDLKAKRLKELTAGIMPGLATVQQLRNKEAGGKDVGARVISVVDRKDEIPVMLACCDAEGEFFCLSLYNAEQSKVAEAIVPLQSVLEISKPHFRMIKAEVKGVEVSYPCLRVAHPGDVTAAGFGNLAGAAVKAVFSSQKPAD